MKAAILTTFSYGGAGKAALRLHRALKQIGADSDLLAKKKKPADLDVVQLDDLEIHSDLIDNFVAPDFYKNIKPGNTLSSLPYPSIGFNYLEHLRAYDLINLHWISDFISLEAICKMDQPIVWTLHDQHPFTGACHYTHGCDKYKDNCDRCPQLDNNDFNITRLILEAKCKYLPKDIIVVSPSNWLADCARQSRLFKNNRIEVIPNAIETGVYKPCNKTEAKRLLGLPEDGKAIMLGAWDLCEQRKGVSYFIEVFRKMGQMENIRALLSENRLTILTFGEGSSILKDFEHICKPMGNIEDENLLVQLYAAADVFALPSKEDNLPNTMLESLACGTPVTAFRCGGMADTITDGLTGYLADPFNTDMMAEQICAALYNEAMPALCRNYAEEHFRLEMQAVQYLQLYEDAIRLKVHENRKIFDIPVVFPELSPFLSDSVLRSSVKQQTAKETLCEEVKKEHQEAVFYLTGEIKRLQNDYDQLVDYHHVVVNKKDADIAYLQKNAEIIKNDHDRLMTYHHSAVSEKEAAVQYLQTVLRAVESEKDAVTTYAERLRDEKDAVTAYAERLRDENEQAAAKSEELYYLLQDSEQKYAELINSVSWKLTKPLRAFARLLRKIIN